MGIRINKKIGYGITDFKGKDDSRVKPEFFDYDWSYGENDLKYKDFVEWCRKNAEDLVKKYSDEMTVSPDEKFTDYVKIIDDNIHPFLNSEDKDYNPRISETISFDSESKYRDRVILFQPLCEVKTWSRHDDTIDYEEAGRFAKNKVTKISRSGIFPFSGGPMIRYKGKPVEGYLGMLYNEKGYIKGALDISDFSMASGRWDKKGTGKACEPIMKELNENWRCRIPFEIVAQMECINIFTDVKSLLNDLKPICYTYWM